MNLKGGGQLSSKTGNGEKMLGKVSELVSVIGLPSKEGFMSMISRNFTWLLILFWGRWYRGWKVKVEDHGVRSMFHSCHVFKQTKIYVFVFCIICFGGDQNLARVEWVVTKLPILYTVSVVVVSLYVTAGMLVRYVLGARH